MRLDSSVSTKLTFPQARAFALQMLSRVAQRINGQWSAVPRFFSIGNDDTFPDYGVASEAYLAKLMAQWNSRSLDSFDGNSYAFLSFLTDDARQTFATGGHYRADVPGERSLKAALSLFFA